jgi:hypothetical protein
LLESWLVLGLGFPAVAALRSDRSCVCV